MMTQEQAVQEFRDDVERQMEQHRDGVKQGMEDTLKEEKKVQVEHSEVSKASEIAQTVADELKPDRVSKTYRVSLQDKAGIWRTFETTVEAGVVHSAEITGRILFDLARKMVDEDIERSL